MNQQTDPGFGKELPNSISAEESLLRCLIADPAAFDRIGDFVSEEDFYRRGHQLIFRAIKEMIEHGRPCDAVTLGEWFGSQGHSELVAGGADLDELSSTAPSATNIAAYAGIVHDKAVLRRLIMTCAGIINDGFQPDGRESAELLAKAEQEVFAIAEYGSRGRNDFTAVNDAMKDAFDVLQTRYVAGGAINGLPTGYVEFDGMTAGLQPTDLIILAARPAMGKTTLALNIAEHAAIGMKKPVAVFSHGMSESQLALRLISSVGRVDSTRLRTGQLEGDDWNRISSAIRLLKQAPIYIDDTAALSPEALRARARRLKREHGLGLIVIDNLQSMRTAGQGGDHGEELSEAVRSLKLIAKELSVPVIVLSQLNRVLERRVEKRPVLSDLRGSGALEDEADLVLFIYRDDYYNKESSPDRGLAEIIIGKQRNGPTGSFKLKFSGEYSRFDNLAGEVIESFE